MGTFPSSAIAAVQTADRKIEIREVALPTSLPADHALLRIESNGVCGSDAEQFKGELNKSGWVNYPLIPGHEPTGRIEWVGDDAARLWHVAPGDRVAVEAHVPCRVCSMCRSRREKFCKNRFVYGYVPLSQGAGLWGGFSQYMVLRPGTMLHRIPEAMSIEDAALHNPLAAGFEWTIRGGGTGVGDRVLIMGPGQRGLACVVAAAEAGAQQIIVTGLTRDAEKLRIARLLGATDVINVEETDVVAAVEELTDGELVDQVLDLTPIATQPIVDAVEAVAPGGTIVFAGIKGMRDVPGFISDRVVLKGVRIQGVVSTTSWAFDQAIRTIEKGNRPLSEMHTHTFPLERTEDAIRTLAGELDGPAAIHVTVTAGNHEGSGH